MSLGAELRFAINIEYYHGFMGSDAIIPDGFTADGENYIKTVALTDNNYQLTADGKGYFIKKNIVHRFISGIFRLGFFL